MITYDEARRLLDLIDNGHGFMEASQILAKEKAEKQSQETRKIFKPQEQ